MDINIESDLGLVDFGTSEEGISAWLKGYPYRCTYQRVQDKNQSRVCQRSPHKSHNEDGTPKSIVKRLTYIYGCPCKL